MKKTLSILFLCTLITPVFADDDVEVVDDSDIVIEQTVAVRRTCTDIKSEIDKLAALSEPTEEETSKLTADRAEYRTKCTARAGARALRRGHAPAPVIQQSDQADNTQSVSASDDKTPSTEPETKQDMPPAPESVVETPEKTPDEIAAEIEANVNAGLCPDGTKPNRFGCCANETFKDMGNAGFNCCPKDGGDCYPPIK